MFFQALNKGRQEGGGVTERGCKRTRLRRVTTSLFSCAGQKALRLNICQHSLSLHPLSFYLLFLSFQKTLSLCFHAMTGTCHPNFEILGRDGIGRCVRVYCHVFVQCVCLCVRMRQRERHERRAKADKGLDIEPEEANPTKDSTRM